MAVNSDIVILDVQEGAKVDKSQENFAKYFVNLFSR